MPVSRSVLTTEYASWPLNVPAGLSITSDTAQVAFAPQSNPLAPSTSWYPATIVVDDVRYPDGLPRFRFLLGPGTGGVTPGGGIWIVFGQITDNPEVPVFVIDTLVLR